MSFSPKGKPEKTFRVKLYQADYETINEDQITAKEDIYIAIMRANQRGVVVVPWEDVLEVTGEYLVCRGNPNRIYHNSESLASFFP